MIMKIAAYGLKVMLYGDSHVSQLRAVTNAGQQQDLRGAECPAGQNDLTARTQLAKITAKTAEKLPVGAFGPVFAAKPDPLYNRFTPEESLPANTSRMPSPSASPQGAEKVTSVSVELHTLTWEPVPSFSKIWFCPEFAAERSRSPSAS